EMEDGERSPTGLFVLKKVPFNSDKFKKNDSPTNLNQKSIAPTIPATAIEIIAFLRSSFSLFFAEFLKMNDADDKAPPKAPYITPYNISAIND
ncbi:MAG: hypothetical protein AABY14_02150, partial [Nanoarchaeota archaeon]